MDEKPDLAKLAKELYDTGASLNWLQIFLDDIAGDNDRSAAITLATLVDDQLGVAIEARLVPLSNTLRGRIYADRGPLGSFSAKIDMGFALGLYGKQTRSNLHLARRIRNRFAHKFTVSSFENEEIASLCKSLKATDVLGKDMKELIPRFPEVKTRYFVTVTWIWNRLSVAHDSISHLSLLDTELP